MTDLNTRADEVNAILTSVGAPIYVVAGKRALKWMKRYEWSTKNSEAYSISKRDAFNILFRYGAEVRAVAQ